MNTSGVIAISIFALFVLGIICVFIYYNPFIGVPLLCCVPFVVVKIVTDYAEDKEQQRQKELDEAAKKEQFKLSDDIIARIEKW